VNAPPVTREYCEALFERVCNWARWGRQDQLGTLNLITPEKRLQAAALVREGVAIGLGNLWPVAPAPDNPWPAVHRMVRAGDDHLYPDVPGLSVALDFIGVECHGIATSHIDALCHVFVNDRMYNAFPASEVKSTGARKNDIMPMADGIVTRGVLLDMPRVMGVEYLSGDIRITAADLDVAERNAGVEVTPGDVLIVHKGRQRRKFAEGAFDPAVTGFPGLHPECAVWLHEHGVAALGSDCMNDPLPNWTADGWPIPIHYLGICGMGMPLLHNLDTEVLARECERRGRASFLLTIAPLKVPGATGSPLNPIALL
jgi:kynurenine formamidase